MFEDSRLHHKIKDVARQAGVSPTTVSRVLNESPLVKDKTKHKVLAVIRELGYTRNAAAKQLRSRKTMMLGVIVPDITNGYFAEIIKGVENTAYACKYKLIICDADYQLSKENEYLGLLRERAVDAMILMYPKLEEAEYAKWMDQGFQLGVIGQEVSHALIPCAFTDNVKFSQEVVELLLDRGHREIVFVKGPEGEGDAQARLQGYMLALKNRHIAVDSRLIVCGGFDEQQAYEAMRSLIERGVRFTAVYSANDEMALGVYRACAEKKLAIPDDVSVIGVDDSRIGRYISPALSSVAQPKYELGAKLTEAVIHLLNDRTGGERVFRIDSQIVLRSSVR